MVEVKKERSELVENLIEVITNTKLKADKDKVKQIKQELKEYKILAGDIQIWINNPEKEIPKLTESELYLFSKEVYEETKKMDINPLEYYTPREIKEIKTTFEGYKTEEIRFPYTFKNAHKLHDGWSLLVSVTELRLLKNGLQIQYNPEAQRSSKVIESDEGEVIPVPKLFKSKLAEIESLFLQKKLRTTTLTFNARLRTADDQDIGEVIFDDDTGELTITQGTMLDCIDGFHRFTATVNAQEKQPDTDMYFMVKLINTTVADAKEEFTQINKVTPVHKAQRDKMDQSKFENFIIEKFLTGAESEIKDKIVSENNVGHKSEKLVSYSVLSDAIEENFKIENRGQAIKVGQYLTNVLNELCYTFPDEFLDNVVETKETSIINANIMFHGYVLLAKKMYDSNAEPSQIENIISDINFDRSDTLWRELNVVDSKGNILNGAKNGIVKYFSDIKI